MLIGNHNTVSIYIFFSNFDYDIDKKTAANKKANSEQPKDNSIPQIHQIHTEYLLSVSGQQWIEQSLCFPENYVLVEIFYIYHVTVL